MDHVITLVHGTWGRNAAWTRDDSALCERLRAVLQGFVAIHRFQWSGANSVSARKKASIALQRKLRRQIAEFPDARHYIIAHSHGGNVALQALTDDSLRERLDGVICLATPFIIARHRELGRTVTASLACGPGVVLGLIMWGFLAIASARAGPELPALVFGLGAAALPILGGLLTLLGWEHLRRYGRKVVQDFALPEVSEDSLLVVRSSFDEASGALITTQFLSWLGERVWSGLQYGFYLCFVKWVERAAPSLAAVSFPTFALAFFVCLVLPSLAGVMLGTWIPALIIGWYLAIVVVYFLVLCGTLGVLLVMLSLATALAHGRELLLTTALVELSAEATPPGPFVVHHLDPPSSASSGRWAGFSHCHIYDDPRTPFVVLQWIDRCRKTRS